MTLKEALAQLSPGEDSHWTEAGHPALAEVEKLFGSRVTRAEIRAAWPDFTRAVALAALGVDHSNPEAETTIADSFDELKAKAIRGVADAEAAFEAARIRRDESRKVLDVFLLKDDEEAAKNSWTPFAEYLASSQKARELRAGIRKDPVDQPKPKK